METCHGFKNKQHIQPQLQPASQEHTVCIKDIIYKTIPSLEVAISPNPQKQTQKAQQSGETKEYAPKEQEETSGKQQNETDKQKPDKEFKVIIMKMLTGLEKIMKEISETFNKETKNIKKNESELKNTITEIKNILERTNRLEDAEHISNLEDRVMERT